MKSIVKNKTLAWIGLVWLILVIAFSCYLWAAGPTCKAGDPDCSGSFSEFLLVLNVYLVPSYILFLFSLDLSKKNRWRYKK